MTGLISRQAVEDLIMETDPWWCEGMTRAIFEGLKRLPTLDVPDRKVGKWETEVRTIHGHKIPFFACSVCGRNADDEYTYCPNCGAYMQERRNRE